MMTIAMLADAYLTHARSYYTQHGRETRTARNVAAILTPFKHQFGHRPITDICPGLLRQWQQQLVDQGRHSRRSINDAIAWLRRMVVWAARHELVDDALPGRLRLVEAIRYGRDGTREGPGIACVPWEHVSATMAAAPLQLATMIELHWLTGMRPGELVAMRRGWLTWSGPAPLYIPRQHKTAHRGRLRVIPLGPAAANLVVHWQRRLAADVDRLWTLRTSASYRQAVQRVQDRHDLPGWTPAQIRHSTATRLRASESIEAARAVLGHRAATTTEIYAEQDIQRAIAVMMRHG